MGSWKRGGWVPATMVVVLAVSAADAEAQAGSTEIVVRDSAGVVIVESSAPSWVPSEAWRIEPTPVLQIGAVDGAEPYLLSRPQQLRRFPDGSVMLVEGQSREIRIYGPDGTHQVTFGGRGDGPGEFAAAPVLSSPTSDTIVAWDQRARRLSWFLRDGTLIRDRSLVQAMASEDGLRLGGLQVWHVRGDGTVVGRVSRVREQIDGVSFREFVPYLIGATDGVVRSGPAQAASRTVDGPKHAPGEVSVTIVFDDPFAPRPSVAVAEGSLPMIVSDGTRAEVRFYDLAGRLARIARLDRPATVLSPEERARALGELETAWAEIVDPAAIRAALDRLPRVDTLPAISTIRTDRAGNLWVARRRSAGIRDPQVFDVLDPEGRWLGILERPEAVPAFDEVGADHVLAVWRNELDVPFVRVYPLVKPG